MKSVGCLARLAEPLDRQTSQGTTTLLLACDDSSLAPNVYSGEQAMAPTYKYERGVLTLAGDHFQASV